MANTAEVPASKPKQASYNVIEIVKDPDGVIATITERADNGRITFMFQREYDQNGAAKQTAYLGRRHIAAVRRLLNDLEEKLETLEDRARARRR
jgi:hypothetical protein